MSGSGGSTDLRSLVLACTRMLEPAFPQTARQEAILLIADYLSVPVSKVRLDMDCMAVSQEGRREILERAARRKLREPSQYLCGSAWFMGERFHVGRGVLIPRPDTEVLVEEALRIAKELFETIAPQDFRFLEYCTGSGCIAVSFVQKLKEAGFSVRGAATDVSAEALAYATENARLQSCADAISFGLEDLTAPAVTERPTDAASGTAGDRTDSGKGILAMILANPPYIRTGEIASLEPEVACYEPSMALDGGPDGLDFYRRILERAGALLVSGGWILLEIGYDQESLIRNLIEKTGYLEQIGVRKDYGGNPRVAMARKRG